MNGILYTDYKYFILCKMGDIINIKCILSISKVLRVPTV